MHIPIGSIGDILSSDRVVLVEDQAENTDGFIFLEGWVDSTGPNDNGAYDSWGENLESSRQFFMNRSGK